MVDDDRVNPEPREGGGGGGLDEGGGGGGGGGAFLALSLSLSSCFSISLAASPSLSLFGSGSPPFGLPGLFTLTGGGGGGAGTTTAAAAAAVAAFWEARQVPTSVSALVLAFFSSNSLASRSLRSPRVSLRSAAGAVGAFFGGLG